METGGSQGWRARKPTQRPKARPVRRAPRIGRKRRTRQKNVEMALRHKGLI